MAVSSSASRKQHNCNGSVKDFSFDFGIGAASEIEVIYTTSAGVETVLTETTHYTVSTTNSDYSSGGTVTTVATYATGNTITILRNVPVTQESHFTEGMATLYGTFEQGLDKLTRIQQQQQEQINRTVMAPKSDSSTGLVFPGLAARANKYLAFDSLGVPIASGGGPGSSDVPTSAYGASLIAAADAAAARAILDVPPVASLMMYAGASAPTGWLICDGSAVSRTTYGALFTVISTTYGIGDGSTTFNLPDFRGRMPIGAGTGTSLTTRTLGAQVGAETHIQTETEVGSHNHTVTDPGHVHSLSPMSQQNIGQGTNSTAWYPSGSTNTGSATTGITINDNTDEADPMDIMNPALVVNFIIKY